MLRLVIQLDDHVSLHRDRRAIGGLGVGVDDDVVDRHLLLDHLLVKGGLLHLVVYRGHRRLLLVLFKWRATHVAIVELGLEGWIHELALVRVHVHGRGGHHHLHVVLLGGELVLRLTVVALPAKILVHTGTHLLLHIVHLLLLEEEGVGGGRNFIRALAILARSPVGSATAAVVRVTASAAATVLVVLVAGDGAKFGLSVSKCAVSSIGTSLISLEEFAFYSFEIVAEASLPLILWLSVPIVPVAVVLGATTTFIALVGTVTTLVAVSFIDLVEIDLVLLG